MVNFNPVLFHSRVLIEGTVVSSGIPPGKEFDYISCQVSGVLTGYMPMPR